MKSLKQILVEKDLKRDTRNSYEFQAFGNRLAEQLQDEKHRALYIRLAKSTPRPLLEMARDFVLGQEKATTKGKLFMWKLKQIKDEKLKIDK